MTTDQTILQRLQQARLPREKKPPKPIAKISSKKAAQQKRERESGINLPLQRYFEYHMANSEPVCAECGLRADWVKQPGNEEIWRACQAHILPKRKSEFGSLAGNLDNHIVLFPSWGGHLCGCHGKYDASWSSASTMKIWPLVVEIFQTKLYPVIPASEIRRIPGVLKNVIPNQ